MDAKLIFRFLKLDLKAKQLYIFFFYYIQILFLPVLDLTNQYVAVCYQLLVSHVECEDPSILEWHLLCVFFLNTSSLVN